MTIRPATALDTADVAEIWNHYIRHTTVIFTPEEKPDAEVADLIATRPAFFVADPGGNLAGFATYAPFRTGAGYARTMEHTVLLRPDAGGAGLGRALMAAVEDHARAAGAHSIFAVISGENPDACAFHARIGYARTAVLPGVGWKFERWLDAVMMQKFLS